MNMNFETKAQEVFDYFDSIKNPWGNSRAHKVVGTQVSITSETGAIIWKDVAKDYDVSASINDIACSMSMEADAAY